MKLSKTKINTYLRCPRQFKFKYIDEIEEKKNKYMILGSNVHLIAEKFLDRCKDNIRNVNIENELIKIAYDLDLGYGLENHIDNLALFFREIFIENEYKLFSYEEYIVDEKNKFSGICDIIVEDEDGNLIIVDYKTSNSNTFSKYRLELCYYMLLVEHVYQRNVSHVGIFFTRNGKLRLLEIAENENKRKYLHFDEIAEAINTMHDVRFNINCEIFHPKEEYTCKFCSYYDICFL